MTRSKLDMMVDVLIERLLNNTLQKDRVLLANMLRVIEAARSFTNSSSYSEARVAKRELEIAVKALESR